MIFVKLVLVIWKLFRNHISDSTYIPRGDEVNGCRVWRCSKNSKDKCIAFVMTKKMRDGTERSIFDSASVHLKYHSSLGKPPVSEWNYSMLRSYWYKAGTAWKNRTLDTFGHEAAILQTSWRWKIYKLALSAYSQKER